METPNLPAADKQPAKVADSLDLLNSQQRVFVFELTEGKSTWEAYQLAGYKGDRHAAYTMKCRLDKELAKMAEARGASKADLMVAIARLNDLPVGDKEGAPVRHITMDQKLKLMALNLKAVESSVPQSGPINMINIDFGDGGGPKPDAPPITASHTVDATVVAGEPDGRAGASPDATEPAG